ncbi:MAG: carbohydrate kinase [Prevotella sp.]|nr:carbohydrate kinase [Prevotella sp.]
MRKVIGIGETVLDIIFKNDVPVGAVPGGSVFNGVISLGRSGVNATFISETGNDRVGRTIVDFLKDNGVNADNINMYPDSKSPISLAFLNENNDAEYIFYKDHPHDRLDFAYPDVRRDDVVMFGSYYAVNPVIRPQVAGFLEYARERGAILYYDVNYRASHRGEVMKLTPNILENLEYADIVRGSNEDFDIMFRKTDPDVIYRSEIAFYTKKFICTQGSKSVELRADGDFAKSYPVLKTDTVSTIGAGDNFNAGFVYGLIRYGITRDMIERGLAEEQWDRLIGCAQRFSANCCKSISNSVDKEFGAEMRREMALEGTL